MGYQINLNNISLDDFKSILHNMRIIPSWKVLKEDIDQRIETLKNHQINNLDELLKTLKDKEKIKSFTKISGLPEAYLSVIRRMIRGYKQTPNKIKDLPLLEEETIQALEGLGIKNTAQLYDQVLTKAKRTALAKESGIHKKEILRLAHLADLCRIRWVNHTFSYVLYGAGYDSVAAITVADYLELYERVKAFNAEHEIYPAHIGSNDMQMVIDAAGLLDVEMEY